MTKKIIVLLMFVFILCGCTAKVDIKIDKRSIDETITVTDFVTAEVDKDMLLVKYRKWMPTNKNVIMVDTEPDERKSRIKYYKREVTDLGNGYNFIYNYNYDFEEYSNAKSLNSAFKSSYLSYNKDDDTITVSTDSAGSVLFEQYKELDNLVVNLNCDYKVLESNADSVNGKVSTWNLSKNNNKKIYIKYQIPKKQQTQQKEDEEETIVPSGEKEENKKDGLPFGIGLLFVLLGTLGFIVLVIVVSKIDSRKYR